MATGTAAGAQEGEPAPIELEEGDTIIVRGVRRSLSQSIEEKRNASTIVDAITAEDIGQLPDENVAESLQRITGVQITRDGGEGGFVNIRGLSAQVQINGRTLVGQDVERDFDFRNLTSEFFQTISVIKSVTAAQTEGTLGGIISLETRRPLDIGERTLSVQGQAQYADEAEAWSGKASALASDVYADDKVGVLLGVAVSNRILRQDTFTSRGGWAPLDVGTATGFDFDGDGVANDVLSPRDLRFIVQDDERARLGLNGMVQLRPTEELDIRFDATWSRLEDLFRDQVLQTLVGTDSVDPDSLVISDSGTLLSATFTDSLVRPDGRSQPDLFETFSAGANVEWTRGPWEVTFDVSHVQGSKRFISQFVRFEGFERADVAYDFRAGDVPSVLLDGGAYNLTDPTNFRAELVFDRIIENEAQDTATQFDVVYDVSRGLIDSLAVGFRGSWRINDREINQSIFRPTSDNEVFFDENGDQLNITEGPLGAFVADFPFSDGVLSDLSGEFPRQWVVGRYPDEDFDNGSDRFVSELNTRPGGLSVNTLSLTEVLEDTYAAYAMGTFVGRLGSVDWSGNAGVRVVKTDLTSKGFSVAGGVATPLEIDNDYTSVLPSANIKFDLTDQLVLRAAAAQVIQRPNIDLLRTGFRVDESSGTATGGNPGLDPFEALQFDLSLEYYTGSDGLLSLAVFHRDVDNFIDTDTQLGTIPGLTTFDGGDQFLISQPINGGGAEITGLELSAQQAFTQLPGMLGDTGIVANYTYSNADTDRGLPYPNLSEHTYNIIGFYDNGRADFRIAYNWRSEFASIGDGGNAALVSGLSEFVGDQGFLDFSAAVDLTENLTFTLEGLNLTDTAEVRYLEIEERLRDYIRNDRRFLVGLRATF